jgi:hypothetical protein
VEIRLKNGSKIETIEINETKRSKPKEFNIVDMVQYYNRNPYKFADYLGIELHWYQNVYIKLLNLLYKHSQKAKLERKYRTFISNIKENQNEE